MLVLTLIRRCILFIVTTSLFFSLSLSVFAEGGISIQGTRIIYPQDSRQESIALRNSSAKESFLVQSWIENADGKKSQDFVVTPPLYLSGPKNENVLRLVFTGSNSRRDKESLYYFVSKAIPSVDKKDSSGKSVIRIAAASRIKLFVRPPNLEVKPEKAVAELSFKRINNKIEITNPTPYYITMTDIKNNGKSLSGIMVPPVDTVLIDTLSNSGSTLTFSTINDSGAISKPVSVSIK